MTLYELNVLKTFDRLVRPEKYGADAYEAARMQAMGWSSSVTWLRAIELYNGRRATEIEPDIDT